MRIRTCLASAVLFGFVAASAGCPARVPVLRSVFNQATQGTAAHLSEAAFSVYFDIENQMGDDFELAPGDATVTRVTWYGAYANDLPVTDDFTLTVYRDNGAGMPDTGGYWDRRAGNEVNRRATSGLVEPGLFDLTIYEYSCEVAGWELDPDTTYYLSIVNETADGTWLWCTNGSAAQGNDFGVHRTTWTEEWNATVLDMAFRLWSDR